MAESIARGVVQSGLLPPNRISTAIHSNPNRGTAFQSLGVSLLANNSNVHCSLLSSLLVFSSLDNKISHNVIFVLPPLNCVKLCAINISSNEGHQAEVRIPMPQIEQPDFITEQRVKLKSSFHEAKRQASGSFQRLKPLIQRVPPILIGIKQDFKKYFEPRLVALGPFHHGNPKFEQSEHSKRKLAALFADENGSDE